MFLLNCKKDNRAFYINATFQTSNIATVNPPRLYTRNGEITDPLIVRKYIDRYSNHFSINVFEFNNGTQLLDSALYFKIHFRENNTARIERFPPYPPGVPSSLENHEASFYNTSPDQLLISEIDSLVMTLPVSHCNDLIKNSISYYPYYNCIPIGSNLSCKWKNTFPVKISENQLSLPMIILLTSSGDPLTTGGCAYIMHKDILNTFNLTVLNTLLPTDTIALQTKEVILQRL